MPGPGFSLHQKIYINSKDVDKFFKYFKPTHDAIIKEPECRFLEVYQDPKEPGTISWDQMTKDYYKDYLAATEPMFIKPREFKIFNRVGAPYYTVKDH
ncbi:hypothetical protein N7468_007577 [Penicillium chermesinum]|uniref:Uncharacterized protein n=1 Tax=Penicillium chermesinum TaxID=63820 RepID=A0A9W9TKM0_9EURO|nr:uncharacterized protein N7468_007577 [Penicillium chermesinum]KAJ5226352.1 hypothetical protein N7468_007577 [Penicillium chermesinum]